MAKAKKKAGSDAPALENVAPDTRIPQTRSGPPGRRVTDVAPANVEAQIAEAKAKMAAALGGEPSDYKIIAVGGEAAKAGVTPEAPNPFTTTDDTTAAPMEPFLPGGPIPGNEPELFFSKRCIYPTCRSMNTEALDKKAGVVQMRKCRRCGRRYERKGVPVHVQ